MKKQDIIKKIIRQVNARCQDGELDIDVAESVVLVEDRFSGDCNICLSHLSVTDNDLTVVGGYCSDVRHYDAENLTAKILKEISSFLNEYVPVTKPTISIKDAEKKIMEVLDKTSMGDVVYTVANDLFQGCVNVVETGNIVRGDNLDSGEAWYDDIRDSFVQAVYDKMLDFLQHGE